MPVFWLVVIKLKVDSLVSTLLFLSDHYWWLASGHALLNWTQSAIRSSNVVIGIDHTVGSCVCEASYVWEILQSFVCALQK